MKMTLNKLIANDIINYGMNQTSGFSYSVFLESYIDEFDNESRQYILDNLDSICDAIARNENVADFVYNKDTKEFDMVFYWGVFMDAVDNYVFDIMKDKGVQDYFELESLREVSCDLLNDPQLKNLTIEKINNSKKMEIDI